MFEEIRNNFMVYEEIKNMMEHKEALEKAIEKWEALEEEAYKEIEKAENDLVNISDEEAEEIFRIHDEYYNNLENCNYALDSVNRIIKNLKEIEEDMNWLNETKNTMKIW